MRCDFCSAEPVRWSYPARDIVLIGNAGSQGAWAACEDCHALIESADYEALARRIVAQWPIASAARGLMSYEDAVVAAAENAPTFFATANLAIDKFLSCRTGPAVPYTDDADPSSQPEQHGPFDPDALCECGHTADDHENDAGPTGACTTCECPRFVEV